jgi:hypothetical protein
MKSQQGGSYDVVVGLYLFCGAVIAQNRGDGFLNVHP